MLFYIENILLKPVTRRQNSLPPLPPIPGPPSKAIPKRDDRWWRTSSRRMLKIIALVRRVILKEPAIEVIVQTFTRIAYAHGTLPTIQLDRSSTLHPYNRYSTLARSRSATDLLGCAIVLRHLERLTA
jgi:hypothetical protein